MPTLLHHKEQQRIQLVKVMNETDSVSFQANRDIRLFFMQRPMPNQQHFVGIAAYSLNSKSFNSNIIIKKKAFQSTY